ncbi:hypothetical protein LWP59_36985 [Amycolatopsis acidiphila]|uniref:Uncharacterized protein n=1 Tax=Amycolatopsis acidiphila TaxID=715473 RepID=A0A558AEH9_9PSEU|nr:hypothetical protein [Amycolatopsis acidiphila]TVT22674.1 hypothetical protein FNH06_12630 [Amycolatopsis acidiphila]UIJ59562.1 hypothetical protein LWP59_36985 [Amycolatopsis acidiphila]GHG80635.1 hypothetical protein GCM10017788_49780 [Amycolatopsis acidiphila]
MTTNERLSTEDLVAPRANDERQVPDDSRVPDDEGTPDDRGTARSSSPGERVELFSQDEIEHFRGRWQSLQTAFVDDPQDTVQGADQLVAEVMQALASTFAEHKRDLETQWQQGEQVATEDLRLALQRYRTFFNELLRD